MKASFKLGEVTIPVSETNDKVELKGLEVQVDDLDLKEYLMILKELPKIVAEIKKITKEDDTPAHGIAPSGVLTAIMKQKQSDIPFPFGSIKFSPDED